MFLALEHDEQEEERRLRDLHGRVKRARAAVASTKGLEETLAGDWRKAAWFYTRFGITEAHFRQGVPSSPGSGLWSQPEMYSPC